MLGGWIWQGVAGAAVLTTVAVAGWGYTQKVDKDALRLKNEGLQVENGSLKRSVVALKAQVEQSAEARAVEAARAEKWSIRAKELDGSIEALYSGDIPDAPLDPRIIAILDAVRIGVHGED